MTPSLSLVSSVLLVVYIVSTIICFRYYCRSISMYSPQLFERVTASKVVIPNEVQYLLMIGVVKMKSIWLDAEFKQSVRGSKKF